MAFQKIKSVPPENALNAVIYARYSSTQQTENSIDGQLRECNRFAELDANLSEHIYMIYAQGAIGCIIKIEW